MAAAPPDGQEKVIAAAQQIVKSLANSKNAADDMIRILSGFDNRFSLMSDLFPAAGAPDAAAGSELPEGDEEEVEYGRERGPGYGGDDDDLEDERDAAVEDALRLIEQWDSPAAGDRLVFESPEDAEEYLAAAACLMGEAGPRVEAALQVAMARLEEEFRQLLIRGTASLAADDLHASLLRRLSLTVPTFHSASSVDLECPSFASQPDEGDEAASAAGRWSSVSDGEISPYLISPDTVSTLKDIADVMLRAGYGPELCQVYSEVRRDTLMECLAVLGVDKMSLEEVQRVEWGVLDGKMKKWIQALRVVVQGLLAEERRICGQILAADADAEEECFTEAAKGCVLQLLNFGDAIAIGKRSSEKLFRILGMYEALAELLPELEALFSGDARDFIKEEGEGILVRLGDAVRGTVAEFANAIRGETSRRSLPGGEIHPLTRYVMNYVRLLADYSRWLNHLLDGCETELENGGDNADMTPLGHCLLILITHLLDKIEDKAKLYDDEALQNIFLMNNLWYVVQKIKDSELKTLLGDNWIRKRRGQIRRYSTGYLRSSWTRVLACLRDDGLPHATGSSSALKAALKERFKSFNLAYEELYRTQTAWRVVDPQLREELKISISEKVLPAYRSFVGRFRGQLEGGRNFAKYIKYNPEDVENQVSDFFEGKKLNA
ncbi:exocyst complex component EXO70B1-like [Hordeum vulgare]|uniref:Exocyst subunit Exo70 family protein n=1 Tax=Hordeum vulgare subsp. vulgare TaxID=112509 RepID=A0A8I6XI96_HORVV|nr:exocyst complex component EXO70B1-like [Hordeum vulgare subsp. vulgare]KAE8816241.1 exocyst complex component EXO70B1-like [Hordeum vulgare]